MKRGNTYGGRSRRRLPLAGGVGAVVLAGALLLPWVRRWHAPPRIPAQLIRRTARRHGLDPLLVQAVIRRESAFRIDARGDAGEVGLMQITEAVIADWERHHRRRLRSRGLAFIPEVNVEIGCWYLARAFRAWRGDEDNEILALAQYNAGPSRARQWARENNREKLVESIPFPATRTYIKSVLAYREQYRERKVRTSHGRSASDEH